MLGVESRGLGISLVEAYKRTQQYRDGIRLAIFSTVGEPSTGLKRLLCKLQDESHCPFLYWGDGDAGRVAMMCRSASGTEVGFLIY